MKKMRINVVVFFDNIHLLNTKIDLLEYEEIN
jgi:hypothetical protein